MYCISLVLSTAVPELERLVHSYETPHFSSGNDLRKRWTQPRDFFQKCDREIMISKSGSAVGKKMKWFLYEQMRFLIPHFSQGKTKSKLSPGSGGEAALEIGRDMSQASTGLTPAAEAGLEPKLDSPQTSALLHSRPSPKFPHERGHAHKS